MKQYVIIGNGVAAAGCIEGIRSVDKDSKIAVISEEEHAVYCRPLISYYLENKTNLERMSYRDADFYDKMGCAVHYGRKAAAIDTASKKVVLDDGASLHYTSVCVAAGSSSFVPPFKGLDSVDNKFSFMTLDDAQTLMQTATEASRVLIVGAGLIGLKCAEGLYERVASITVCDLANRVLSSILDTECAAIMQKHLEAKGIRFMLGDSVERFENNSAVMNSGETVGFDILVLAVGVRANTSLIKEIGGAVNRGIIVDEYMRTSIDGIYAAGDCAEGDDISCGQKRVLALHANAYMQGHAAGVNMGGGSEVFNKAIPMNSIGFFGLHIMTAGSYDGEIYEEKDDSKRKRLFLRDGRLVGFILVGDTERAGIYTSLIREKTPLDTIDFEILKKVATSAAFSQEQRRKKFGSVV